MSKPNKIIYYYLDLDNTTFRFPHLLVTRIKFKSIKAVSFFLTKYKDFLQKLYSDKNIKLIYLKE